MIGPRLANLAVATVVVVVTLMGAADPAAAMAHRRVVVSTPGAPSAIPGTTILMGYPSGADFYGIPFPCESRRLPTGRIDLSRFPGRRTNALVNGIANIVERDADGFGVMSGVFFQSSARLGPSRLPTLDQSVVRGSPVYLVSVDPGSPDYLRRYPVDVEFIDNGGPHGTRNMLSLLPLQGVPLREGTLYAAVVLRSLRDLSGQLLGVSQSMAALAVKLRPAGMPTAAFNEYLTALRSLEQDGLALTDAAGVAVFRTGRPTAEYEHFVKTLLRGPLPPLSAPLRLVEVFPEFVVLQTTIFMPVYQAGSTPFLHSGGYWQRGPNGQPLLAAYEEANFYVTVPRKPMPAAGFPAVVFIRTGAGPDRALVDRVTVPNGAPGDGPALEFARAGYIGVQADGPHGGRRNASGQTGTIEQLLLFNVLNPVTMRDNFRQSSLEIALLAEALPGFSIDLAQCPGVTTPGGGPVKVDGGTIALFGHSMGATMAPLCLAFQPRFKGAILSGAGGSWIENVMFKMKPFDMRHWVQGILAYPLTGSYLRRHDPVLSLLQWGGDASEPPVYAPYCTKNRVGGPCNVLMIQGIVDNYNPPRIANAMSLSLGLDLAGPELDLGLAPLPQLVPLADVFRHGGTLAIPLPVSGNGLAAGSVPYTAVVVQYLGDGVQDAHEVAYQLPAARLRYRTFLETLAQSGLPRVQ